MMHGNTRYPELHDKEILEDLVKQYGTSTRISRVVGCRRQNVEAALNGFGIHAKRYVTSDMKRTQFQGEES